MTADRTMPAVVAQVADDATQAGRPDLYLAPVLERWGTELAPSRVMDAARMRVQHGPMLDALSCLPSAGDGAWLDEPGAASTRARLELFIWEAGGGSTVIPGLGPWLARGSDRWARWVLLPARAGLFSRARTARLLEVAADGFVHAPALRREQARRQLVALAEHPEPLVWIPATRALGRVAAYDADAQATLTHWLDGESAGLRRRALTAAACVPATAAWWPGDRVQAALDDDDDPWGVAAIGPSLPYLCCERRELWLQVAERLRSTPPGPEVSWSVVQGLLALELRGALDRPGRALLRAARTRALEARPRATTQAQLWLEVQRRTDFLDGIDPDPEDLELLMRRAVRAATQAGPERVAARMRSLAGRLEAGFEAALDRAESPQDNLQHAAALCNLDSCARAAALGLWRPALTAAGRAAEADAFDEVPARMLARLEARIRGADPDYPRHRAALRALGLLMDARPREGAQVAMPLLAEVPLRGNRAKGRFRKPVADVLYRLLDRASQPGLPSKVRYARFAAWYALAAESLTPLGLLERSSELARQAETDDLATWLEDLRGSIQRGHRPAEGGWTGRALDALDVMHAGATPLAFGLEALGEALRDAAQARRGRDDDGRLRALERLATASARWARLVADPAAALDDEAPSLDVEAWPALEAARDVVLEGRGAGQPPDEVAERWASGHGPVLGPVVKTAVERLLTVRSASSFSRTPTRRTIGGYRLIEPLGSGAQGEVWLVEQTRVGRRFVMKLLPAASATGPHAAALQDALEAEAGLLRRLYHPNVARFVDSGQDQGQPYLVLEYLIGCDLDHYGRARHLSAAELIPIVQDVGAGLEALSVSGLVHCDLKPQNVFLQLALPPEAPRFDPSRDRDPRLTPMLGAVVIDFGIARTMASVQARDDGAMSGTLGFLAPEQVKGDLHPRTDVYALAATIFRAMTGGTFFDHLTGVAAKLMAHGEEEPFSAASTREALPEHAPAGLLPLLREATRVDPEARPDVAGFVERFCAL